MIWVFLVLFAAPAHVLSASDTDLKNEVEQRLAKEEDVARKVHVTVRGSEVTLSGTVKTLWQKEWAIDRVEDTKGVESVVSNLAVMAPDSQEALAEAVARAINRYPYYTVFDWAEIHVEDSVVTISGEVTSSPDKPGDIRDRVSRVPGVKAIVNEIEVLSPARGDQRIRSDLARRLFGQSSFSRYLSVPPLVHITVRNGYVTLRGTVHDEGDKILADSIARRIFGVIRVYNELTW